MELVVHIFMILVAAYSITMYSLGIILRKYASKPKKDYRYQPTVSVLMPAFNESKHAYDTIKSMRNSNYPVNKLEILAYDDWSKDDTFNWMQKAAKEFPNVVAIKNKKNQGKALTMIDAALASKGDILVGVDSDCIFHPDSIKEMVAILGKNPKIAAVGGRVGVSNTNESWLSQIQAVFYLTSFMFIKEVENAFRKIQCLSGPLVAIRKERYVELIPEIKSRTFLGAKITNGEDRALTQMLLRKGWETYVEMNAICWTSVPITLSQYILQQLRWRRSAIGQWVEAIYNLPKLLHSSGFMSTLFSLAPIYVLFSWIVLLISSAIFGNLLFVLVSILLFHAAISPIIALVYINATNNSEYEAITNKMKFLYTFFMSIFWFPISGLIITIVAMFSLDDGGWVTRE